jgi:hypothetical protein
VTLLAAALRDTTKRRGFPSRCVPQIHKPTINIDFRLDSQIQNYPTHYQFCGPHIACAVRAQFLSLLENAQTGSWGPAKVVSEVSITLNFRHSGRP